MQNRVLDLAAQLEHVFSHDANGNLQLDEGAARGVFLANLPKGVTPEDVARVNQVHEAIATGGQ